MAPGRKYAFVDVISVPFAIAAVERPLYCSERAYQCRHANVGSGRTTVPEKLAWMAGPLRYLPLNP